MRNMSSVGLNRHSRTVLILVILIIVCWTVIRYILVPWNRSILVNEVDESTAALKWWQTSVIYQIYPRSFQDSNADGTGDLKGIISRLGYIEVLNVGAIWISPFYKSPMRDFGYDVTDYKQIDPIFGDMSDFERLIQDCHNRGIKVLIDFVPNHTSNESVWFEKSRTAQPGDKYRDYYIWSPGITLANGTKLPPNNWEGHFGGSAWTWDSKRGEFYYHAFLTSQPDLNYRNEAVLQDIDEVLDFWLAKGVDGFRVDAITKLFEVQDLTLNNPFRKHKNEYVPNLFKHTEYQPEIFAIVRRWRLILDKWEDTHSSTKVLIAETSKLTEEQRKLYYEEGSVPFYFNLIHAKKQCGATAKCFQKIISDGMVLSSKDRWPNFVIGNHDNKRVADRMGDEFVDAMNMLLLTLPGTPTTYYGEELGMHGGYYKGMTPKDPYAFTSGILENSRDPERNPMQWDSTRNAGFTSAAKPWLPITDNTKWKTCNVKEQMRSPLSSLSIYRSLVKLRQKSAFRNPEISNLKTVGEVLIYTRSSSDDSFLIAINFSKAKAVVSAEIGFREGLVSMATKGGYASQTVVYLDKLNLLPGEGLLILVAK